ncbi:hypothetical protein DYB32_000665 [Aphanomyces invadans]|uniref:Methyltransferase type 11 domain-containing protein n=1 Tax=Aphanomyces invadans TaxID=157072 RepID=A0A418B992_9STRA|nr:hypothetical protein DYB32_000665 [Aphanomyces invadans]
MLFDTRSFAIGFGRNLMATWEWQREAWAMLASDSISKSMRHTHTTDLHRMHVVIPSQSRPTAQPSSDEEGSKDDDEAKESREPNGWTVVNIQRLRHVDLVREMKDLHGIGANTVTAIYSSHALEHCGYGVHAADVSATLAEWHRVLKAGGALFLSVPDLSVLATLFVDPTLTPGQRFHVMRMMYGGQTDGHDFHKTGFDRVILDSFLTEAGFCNVTRVKSFGLFQDTSDLVFQGKSISLNVVAKACKRGQVPISVNLPATSPA